MNAQQMKGFKQRLYVYIATQHAAARIVYRQAMVTGPQLMVESALGKVRSYKRMMEALNG